jgi:hypothetical protein
MTIDKQNTHSGIFYGHPFGPLPAVPSSIPEVPPVGDDALTTPNDPDTATVAGVLGPQEDSPQDAPPHPPFPESPAGADFVYLCDLQPRPVEWLWQDRLACGTLAMISGVPGSGKTLDRARHRGRSQPWPRPIHLRKTRTLHRLIRLDGAQQFGNHSPALCWARW